MARNLQERLEVAKGPRARIADNEALIADLKAEQERLEAARDQASAESVDFALSDADRDEAAAKAARLDRTVKSLGIEIAAVAALTEERRSDDARKAAEAEKRAALTERDEIAAQFAERVPVICDELVAEMHARGIPANGLVGTIQAHSYRHMKIPVFGGIGRAWPIDLAFILAAKAQEMTEQGRKTKRLDAEASR